MEEMKDPAKASKKLHLFLTAIIAAVVILSAAALASTAPIITVNPVPPSSTEPGSPPATTSPAPAGANPAPQPVSVTPAPALAQPMKDVSHNWVGYAVTGDPGSITDVKGSWIVPAVNSATGSDGYSAFWVGIDGFNSHTVEQIGTESDYVNGSPQYYAWFELFPNYPHEVPISVSPGDHILAEVKYDGGNTFTLSLTNLSAGQSFQRNVTVSGANRSSAEWIAEAPSADSVLPLADFSSVQFGPGDLVTMNGITSPFGTVSPLYQIFMGNSRNLIAQPTAVSSDGSSFSVQVAG